MESTMSRYVRTSLCKDYSLPYPSPYEDAGNAKFCISSLATESSPIMIAQQLELDKEQIQGSRNYITIAIAPRFCHVWNE